MKNEKRFLRTVALILFIVLAVQLPSFALPADFREENSVLSQTEQGNSEGTDAFGAEVKVIGEDEALRTEDTKHFILSDGTHIAAKYESAVHYEKDGAWEDIDNTLTLQDAVDANDINGFINTSSGIRYKFANSSKSAKLFRMKFGDHDISWGLKSQGVNNVSPVATNGSKPADLNEKESAMTLEKVTSKVLYENIFDGIDLEYVIRGNDVKENIIIKQTQSAYSYTFEIKANGLTATLEEDGSVSMKDASGYSVLTIPAPFMYDADGEYSQDVSFSLSEGNGNGKYELTVTADKEWINSASLPVTIDPYIQPESNTQSFATSWYTQASPNSHTETYSFVAGHREGTINRGYLKILSLPTLSSSDVVTDATLVMCQGGSIFPTNTDSKAAFVYMATNRSSTYPTWNSQPMESEALDYNKRTIDNDTYITYNITRAVKKWYKDPTSNFGLIFVGSNETCSSDAFIRYWSEDNGGVAYRPKLYVSYLNCKGLEDYQSYHTSSAGSAGTGYVNDFSGALTFVHTDFVGSGSRMPISISHVYNSTDVGEDRYYTQFYTAEMKSGNGWKLNIQEKIRNITNAPEDAIEDSNATYVHTDADGTEHYFILKEGQSATGNPRSYICETNPDLTLTRQKTNDVVTFTMTNDKTHYSKVFDKDGYITKCTDSNGNSITYYYAQYNTVKNGETVTYKYITSISDGAGRVYSFNYDSSHRVTSITDPSGKSITYTYDSASGNLTTVTYPWNTTSTFEYNSNGMLIKATDSERNYSIEYTYGTGADSRKVLQVTEKGGSQTGITLGITYNDNATTEFRTAGSDDIYGNDDDMLTVYGFDYLGRCVVCYTTGTDKDRIYGVSSASFQNSNKVSTGNKLTESAAIGMYSENLLNDPNFEDSSKGCYESNATVTVDTTEHYLGEKSRKIVISEAKPDVAGFVLYSIANTSGKHTFSVYVKLSSITAAPDAEESGLAIKIKAPDNAITEKVFPFESSPEYIGKWQRIELTADISRNGNVDIIIGLKNASGTLFADMAQFEKGECATYPNAVSNGSFVNPNLNGWTTSDANVSSYNKQLRIVGNFLKNSYAEQTVVVNDNVSDTFILSGWGKATSAQTLTSEQEQETSNHNIVNKTGTRFMLKATVKYEDKNISTGSARTNRTYTVEIPFNEQYTGWQFVSKPIIIKPDNGYEVTKINTVTVAAVYSKNLNTAYFDKISLVRDVACSYTYDKNGNVISTQALKEQKSNLEYSPSNELTKQTNPSGYDYTYTYYSNHNLASATSESGVKTSLTYDSVGNPTQTVIATPDGTASSNIAKIYSSATYTDRNYIASITDSRGNTTYYDVNSVTGITNSVTDARGGKIVYTYDERDRLANVNSSKTETSSVSLKAEEVSYTYENGRLSAISVPMKWDSNGTGTRMYSFVYDSFGNIVSTKYNSRTLMTNTYAPNNGKLTSSEYGTGTTVNYYYDNLDRLVSMRYNDNENTAFDYTYDYFGAVAQIKNTATGMTKVYDYDTIGRLITSRTESSEGIFATHYTYDGLSRLDTLKYTYSTASGANYSHEYNATYGKDNLIETFGLENIFSIIPTFDGLGRQSERVLKNGSGSQVEKETYSFVSGTGGSNATTTLIGSVTYYGSGSTGTSYSYTYDENGNLKTISKNGTLLHEYTYDSLNQLTTWYDATADATTAYSYYKGGNLAKIFSNGDFISFTYGGGDGIADRIVVYDGQLLSYDMIGNPLTYRDGMSFTWKNGKQLATYTQGQTSASYNYNESGIRTDKTVNGITTTYQLDGSKIVSENRNGTVQEYFYDESGSVLGIVYNGSNYYFRKNFRNDVLAILNASGSVVVGYSYDPWGNILSVTGSMASTLGVDNPFRYRSYYYDTESGLYYLNSRYYDAKVCRFVNADSVVAANGLYSYCINNPVNYIDTDGYDPVKIYETASTIHGLFSESWASLFSGIQLGLSGLEPVVKKHGTVKAKMIYAVASIALDVASLAFTYHSGDKLDCFLAIADFGFAAISRGKEKEESQQVKIPQSEPWPEKGQYYHIFFEGAQAVVILDSSYSYMSQSIIPGMPLYTICESNAKQGSNTKIGYNGTYSYYGCGDHHVGYVCGCYFGIDDYVFEYNGHRYILSESKKKGWF